MLDGRDARAAGLHSRQCRRPHLAEWALWPGCPVITDSGCDFAARALALTRRGADYLGPQPHPASFGL